MGLEESDLQRYYEFVGREPAPWLLTALDLKAAADALASRWIQDLDPAQRLGTQPPPRDVGPAFMMLAGFAIENLAKAILIKRDPSKFPLKPARKGGLQTHEPLLEQVRSDWTGEERTLGRRLAEFASWSGRYPLPMNARGLESWPGYDSEVFRPDGSSEVLHGHSQLPGAVSQHDAGDVDRLFSKLLALLHDEPGPAPER